MTGSWCTGNDGRFYHTDFNHFAIAVRHADILLDYQFHVAGRAVHAWTVAESETATRLAEAAVDGVIADRPDVLEGGPDGT